ncbi:hypothetical protein EXT68_23465 [Pectobacterium parmentieri]|uniref:Uncharacterized protein n=1 Tax=Pectobacterium parmentieri TaxID=1905730 RepID=A0A0H3HYN7_PECPM|nr:hypothetical protein [Pectobacterium parmentieri]AFI88489.1 Hypothetical protein W5S_0362 [Pectobacterium parmentieri]MBI0473359.1 hypothetical protein [Pectobacterium parmentieri]MBI0495990.1 hypothetical protein [Pectobacterium parmentieri]MBI0557394.1 hypothetical protein [Pectobacterium parmentieri]MBI0570524.1 hypothetical protein [Pectobacterium parmentieri]
MKMVLLIIGCLLGAGGFGLYQWMKPPSDDPYFFLTQKATIINDEYYSIDKSIKLYKKGEVVDFYFWNVPQPQPKLLYLFPVNTPSPKISILLKRKKSEEYNAVVDLLFEDNHSVKNDDPFLTVVIYKINNDLTESVFFKKEISSLKISSGSEEGISFGIKELGYEYGQYRAVFEVLSDNDKIKNDDVDFYVHISQYSTK